jgi:TldD protein
MVGSFSLMEKMDIPSLVRELEDKLKIYFAAGKAPAGRMPLVADNVLTHVFFHEAVGHATEADAILEKSSVLVGKLGQQIAPESLNLFDTPKIKNEHGFYHFDDEGVKAHNTQLIKNGVLNSYLHSIETANKMGVKPTGNGRAQNAFNMQIPRMSNTVLANGDYRFDELFEGIKRGIYAKDSQGGVVEPTTGNFLFNAREAYLVENGKITKPVMGVSFGGNILDILMKIERIGNDQVQSFGGWRCGKDGQSVPVGGAVPHIMISEAMVGGTK